MIPKKKGEDRVPGSGFDLRVRSGTTAHAFTIMQPNLLGGLRPYKE